jgi:hypothetical protein
MPTTPIIIPIIVAGITLGSLLVSKTQKISKKKLATASLLGGLLNTAYAFLIYTLFPPTTFTRNGAFTGGGAFGGGGTFTGTFTGGGSFRAAATGGSETTFVVSAFVTGFLIVLAIVVVALAYARYRGRGSDEETETDQSDTDLSDQSEEAKLE